MNFNDYQKQIKKTWIAKEERIVNTDLERCILGICEEAGEIAGKRKKWLRGDYTWTVFIKEVSPEIGDLLYYCFMLINILRLDIFKILKENIKKLQSRKERGTIKGTGDNR